MGNHGRIRARLMRGLREREGIAQSACGRDARHRNLPVDFACHDLHTAATLLRRQRIEFTGSAGHQEPVHAAIEQVMHVPDEVRFNDLLVLVQR